MTQKLNVQQQQALLEIHRPVLILAGAGSGKTRVLTHKIVHLIEQHSLPPSQILAVTFTNKAAKEMKERVHAILSQKHTFPPQLLWVSTFHSACARILRKEIQLLNYQHNFSIYDPNDQQQLIRDIIKTHKLESPTDKIPQILTHISNAKSNFQSPAQVIHAARQDSQQSLEQLGHIYKHYEQELFKNNALDFDDLILKVIQLLQNEQILHQYQAQFQYILVDEFQDTNHAQYKLIKALAQNRGCISVVGDDDQSIYSWRGAEIQNIINFQKDFKNCAIIKLEQNYRSTNTILNAAHSLVTHNHQRIDKKLWSDKSQGEKLLYFSALDDRLESTWIARKIQALAPTYPHKNIAILYRMNHQSRVIEEALRRERIPYKIFGNIEFYERMEVKDLLSYLIIFSNQQNAIAFKRVLQVPKRGIGDATLLTIDTLTHTHSLSFYNAIIHALEHKIVQGKTKTQLTQFLDWFNALESIRHTLTISKLLKVIIKDTGYLSYLQQRFTNYEDRLDNVRELESAIKEYELEHEAAQLNEFLSELALQTTSTDEAQEDAVNLMTLHNSKGLEFDIVFVSGLNEGLFPHYRSTNSIKELEEERRLFYVALTRAKERCFLSSSAQRFQFGKMSTYTHSSFIKEISQEYLNEEHQDYNDYQHPTHHLDFSETNMQLFTPKQRVYHEQFGEGIIQKLYTHTNIPTVEVKFSDKTRILIIKYTKLTLHSGEI